MIRFRSRYLVLILSTMMVISGITTSWLVQNNCMNVITSEIDLYTSEGVLIHCTQQVPKIASNYNPVPGIIVIHGSLQSKEWMMAFSIELARRNFVVLTIDVASHGNSQSIRDGEMEFEDNSDYGGAIALEYLKSLSYVNKIGFIGHSMGAEIAIQALELKPEIIVDALIYVGGVTHGLYEVGNTTYPHNLLITVGKYDELHNIAKLYDSLKEIFGTSQIFPDELYGDFTNGSARKFIIGPSTHLFETIDPIIITETIKWAESSLKEKSTQSVGILIYPMNVLGGLIATIGLILSIFPLMVILLDFHLFKDLKNSPSSDYHISSRSYWILGLLLGFISLIAFLPALILPSSLPFTISFPQNLGLSVVLWFLIVSIVSFILLVIIYLYNNRKKGINWQEYAIDQLGKHKSKNIFCRIIKSGILAFMISMWLILWELFVDTYFALDFRIFLPFFQDLTLIRLLIMPIYLIFTLPFFIIEGMWFSGILRTQSKETAFKSHLHQIGKAVFIKCLPYTFIILVQLIISLFLGQIFISGKIGYNLIFLWIFTPFFVISTSILVWSYRLTSYIYVGAFLNSFIFSWGMATILPLTL